jgi:peptidoglycan-associated lipoprotein
MKTKTVAVLSALAAAALLAGCGTSVPLNEVPVESRPTAGTGTAGATGSGTGSGSAAGTTPQSRVATVDLSKTTAVAAPAERVVYFDFDSFVIRDESKPVIDGHAKALTANRAKRITIEGHTDERGGREYNLALGQKRAEAVAKTLTLLGVTDAQVEAVSFGEERPAVQGSDEAAWAKNRRAELKDR